MAKRQFPIKITKSFLLEFGRVYAAGLWHNFGTTLKEHNPLNPTIHRSDEQIRCQGLGVEWPSDCWRNDSRRLGRSVHLGAVVPLMLLHGHNDYRADDQQREENRDAWRRRRAPPARSTRWAYAPRRA